MKYTFWYCGVLIGHSRMKRDKGKARHLSGAFEPTPYGLELFPRLTGILTAGHELKSYLDANGLTPEAMSRDEIEQIFETIPAGQKVIDLGRTLSDVEMHAPDGRRIDFESIGFSDLLEFQMLADESGDAGELSPDGEPPTLPPGVPRYLVSATLSKTQGASIAETQAGRLGAGGVVGPVWSSDN